MPACPSCGADIARIGAACLRCGRSVDPAHEPTRSAPFANGLPATGPVAGTLVAGRYRVERPLGRGGMGVVLLARDESLDRRVALKLLSSEAARDDTARRRFAREARAVAALDHPFICKLYDVDDSTEPPFLVLEYIDGEVLGARLRREPLPAAEAWRLAAEIADALRRAHAAGIVHRDLKPGNVILTPDGHAKVTDFGLARRVEPDSDDPDATAVEALTRTGGLTGTPSFMAPEQLRAEPADARSDQFALGLVIFEMVAGAHPFRRSALADTIGAILRDPAPPLSSAAAGVTRDEDRVVARLLAKRPEDRFADSEQVHAALSAAAAARAAGGPPSSDRSTSRLRRSVAAVVATALVAVLAAVWLVSREPSEALTVSNARLLSTFPGSHSDATFSPDGESIAFADRVADVRRIWRRPIQGGDATPLTPPDMPAGRPRWSPDGETVMFEETTDAYDRLWTVPAGGGTPRLLLEYATNGSWSADGRRIVFEPDRAGAEGIRVADADGSHVRQVDGVPEAPIQLCDLDPSLSPDGSTIAFWFCPRSPLGDLWTIPAGGGPPRRLTHDETFGGDPVWTPDGRFIIVSSMRGGSRTLWSVPGDGGEPRPLTRGAGADTEPAVSPDGTRLVFANARDRFTLRIDDPDDDRTRSVLDSRYDIVDPEFSPDGRSIAWFGFADDGGIDVFVTDLDGGGTRRLGGDPRMTYIHPAWSADGSTIYAYRMHPDPAFVSFPAAGGPPTVLVDGWDRQRQNGAAVDPTGTRVIYTLMEGGVPRETRLRDLATGEERRYPPLLRYCDWAADGRRVVCSRMTPESTFVGRIAICDVESERCRDLGPRGALASWSADERHVDYLAWIDRTTRELRRVAIDGTDDRAVRVLSSLHPIGGFYSVASDGRIVSVEYEAGRRELWLAELERGS